MLEVEIDYNLKHPSCPKRELDKTIDNRIEIRKLCESERAFEVEYGIFELSLLFRPAARSNLNYENIPTEASGREDLSKAKLMFVQNPLREGKIQKS